MRKSKPTEYIENFLKGQNLGTYFKAEVFKNLNMPQQSISDALHRLDNIVRIGKTKNAKYRIIGTVSLEERGKDMSFKVFSKPRDEEFPTKDGGNNSEILYIKRKRFCQKIVDIAIKKYASSNSPQYEDNLLLEFLAWKFLEDIVGPDAVPDRSFYKNPQGSTLEINYSKFKAKSVLKKNFSFANISEKESESLGISQSDRKILEGYKKAYLIVNGQDFTGDATFFLNHQNDCRAIPLFFRIFDTLNSPEKYATIFQTKNYIQDGKNFWCNAIKKAEFNTSNKDRYKREGIINLLASL
ncbi:MAG: hypothetical protein J6P03_06580 [Opitutales bacterium]|nr:hypothetical protein [Opitutales bacterium]